MADRLDTNLFSYTFFPPAWGMKRGGEEGAVDLCPQKMVSRDAFLCLILLKLFYIAALKKFYENVLYSMQKLFYKVIPLCIILKSSDHKNCDETILF